MKYTHIKVDRQNYPRYFIDTLEIDGGKYFDSLA